MKDFQAVADDGFAVVGAPAFEHSSDDCLAVELQCDNGIDVRSSGGKIDSQGRGLPDGARITVQDESVRSRGSMQLIEYHVSDQVIRY
jgi:hypothetical protein